MTPTTIAAPESPWIEWAGGERPVHMGAMVQYRTRQGGEVLEPVPAYSLRWRWDERGYYYDVSAYRVQS